MNGNEVNSHLERGLFGKAPIKRLIINYPLNILSDDQFLSGHDNSVTQQAVRIDADWDDNNKILSLVQANAGPGLWIPWIESSPQTYTGAGKTPGRGLGTYTPVLDPNITWVASGPFSGCYAVSFYGAALNHWVFAHIVTSTPTSPYPTDTVDNQIANISNQTGLPVRKRQLITVNGGSGFIFWTLRNGTWCRRVIWALQGEVKHVGQREDE